MAGRSPTPAVARRARHRLYRNRGNGTFEDVTDRSGIQHREYGMGACAGDYDGDGRPDLYITNVGPNALYRNRGDGTFTDVTATARVGDPRWSASCAFADLDRDGDLDLWVVNYVDADRTHSPFCGNAAPGVRFYCHPLKYDPLPNTVYRNDGGGVFTDVSAASGVGALRANGLGVVIADYDDDGWPDVFVANDTHAELPVPQHRQPAVHGNGARRRASPSAPTARRAPAWASTPATTTATGGSDLVITNLDFEMHTLNRGLERGLFGYATTESGIGFPTLPFVGFGVAFLDFDNDAQLDIAIANGHILDNAPQFRAGVHLPAAQAAVPQHDAAPLRRGRPQRRARHSPPRRSAAGSRPATSTTTATSTCSSPTTARTPSCCATTAAIAANALLVRLRGAGEQHRGHWRADSAHRRDRGRRSAT